MRTSPLVERARELDRSDPLAHLRERFKIEDPNLVYLDGNSLGRLCLSAIDRNRKVLEDEWGNNLVRAWSDWFGLPAQIGDQIGRIIGAAPGETIIADSTSVNLFKLVVAALRKKPSGKIVTDKSNFPSDLYIIQGAVALLGRESDLLIIDGEENFEESTAGVEDLSLLALSHVCFKSGFMYDGARLTDWAHSRGGLCLWDLSHAAGAVPVDLNDWGADMAVGCTYKYLNGGPGAPAFLFVSARIQHELSSPIWGWIGMRRPFSFELAYEPAPGIEQFMVGTPPILSLTPIAEGVDLILVAGMTNLREKSVALTEFMIQGWTEVLQPLGVNLGSPTDTSKRGSHVSFRHPEAYPIDQALIEEHGVIPDFRAPDTIRFGVCPLYTSFREVAEGIIKLAQVIESKSYERYGSVIGGVT